MFETFSSVKRFLERLDRRQTVKFSYFVNPDAVIVQISIKLL